MFLIIDNFDSFTYNLVQYIQELGEEIEVYKNDSPIGAIEFRRYTGIVLSPGPSRPEKSGISLDILRDHGSIPVLGVCLGMQAMIFALGGQIVSARRIMHGKADEVRHYGGRLFEGVPERFSAIRYHSLAASQESLPACLEVAARASDGEIMSVRHRARFMWGIQFHPESYMTEHGMRIIRNFIGGAYEYQGAH